MLQEARDDPNEYGGGGSTGGRMDLAWVERVCRLCRVAPSHIWLMTEGVG